MRDAVIRHFHDRESVERLQEIVIDAGRTMKRDGMTLEEILVVLKGAVSLAAEHVNHPPIPERAVWLRSQMAPWVIRMYVLETGDFTREEES